MPYFYGHFRVPKQIAANAFQLELLRC